MGLIKEIVIAKALNVPINALEHISDKLNENSGDREEKLKEKLFKKHPDNNHIIVEIESHEPKTCYSIYDKDLMPIYSAQGKKIKKKADVSIFDMKSIIKAHIKGGWINKFKLFEEESASIKAEYGLDNRFGEMIINSHGIQKELVKYENWSIDTSRFEKEITIFQDGKELAHIEKHPIRGIYVIDMIADQDVLPLIVFAISYDVGCVMNKIKSMKEMHDYGGLAEGDLE